MPKLKRAVELETAFARYVIDEMIGEGGAGRVFGGAAADGSSVAVKILAKERASTDKRGRFKNEIAFLSRNRHPNIVSVIDYGISEDKEIAGPFYVMPRFDGSLREVMRESRTSAEILGSYSQILDGVEAAHMLHVVHRDLKPENILHQRKNGRLVVADFGIARFTEDILVTFVETAQDQRLANFQYAAPEQRTVGGQVTERSDIYALGLILNETFTGTVPHGTQYKQIAEVDKEFGFLDAVVAKMLAQSPADRPQSIADVKALIQRYRADAVSLQRISSIDNTVIKHDEVEEPLAREAPRLVDFDWNRGALTLVLDRPVTPEWVQALHNMGSYRSIIGKSPEVFAFRGNRALVPAAEHEVQGIIDYFKEWLPRATLTLKQRLEDAARKRAAEQQRLLQEQRAEEERRLRLRRSIRV